MILNYEPLQELWRSISRTSAAAPDLDIADDIEVQFQQCLVVEVVHSASSLNAASCSA